eukprot:jgi/Botrbrau1/13034/Bobra.0389s0025.2
MHLSREKPDLTRHGKEPSKRRMGNADINVHSPTGFPHWRDLPWELQKSVLASRALSLHDLAKVAPLGRVFKEVYRERCGEEEQWLEHAAVSALGRQRVDTLVGWVSCPQLGPDSSSQYHLIRKHNLSEGEPWPQLNTSPPSPSIWLQQPARFLSGVLQNLEWRFETPTSGESSLQLLEETEPGRWDTVLFIFVSWRTVYCNISPRLAAQVLPCLGLVYLAYKKAAEFAESPQHPAAGWDGRPGNVYIDQGLPAWSDAPGVPPDVQRPLAAISMRSQDSGHCKFGLFLRWDG